MMMTTNNNNRPKTSERQHYGVDISLLRSWQRDRTERFLDQEYSRQEIAVTKVRDFLDAIDRIVKIQSWYRMVHPRRRYHELKSVQTRLKNNFFRAIRLYGKSEKMCRVNIYGKFFLAWKEETLASKWMQHVIQEFFQKCIQRLRLTPQAIMAFFHEQKWTKAVPRSDLLKIRRLVLQKLFDSWRTETKNLSTLRYKASQILSRMMRRTKGPMWVKESLLVCFHMWSRYISVKKAYRLRLPDPRFSIPFLPQWTKLYKDITVSRMKKKRTMEIGTFVMEVRFFAKWKRMMTIDRSKPVTPLAVAIMHYSTVLLRKVVTEWHELLRERGKIVRFRDRIFYKWKKWAPHYRNMRLFMTKAINLIQYKKTENAFKAMVRICTNVIGKRTEKIKELRRNYCDRRVVICAYALLHKDSHMMMVDCWRR